MADLKFYVVTFNCGRELIDVNAFAEHLLDGWENPSAQSTDLPDVIVFNFQEFAPLSHGFLGGNLLTPYFDRFSKAVSSALEAYSDKHDIDTGDFINVMSHNLGLQAAMIFAKKSLLSSISSLEIAEVAVGNFQLGNKGAIGTRIGWNVPHSDKSLYTTFVCAHLAPMEGEVQRRDQNYTEIVEGLVFTGQDAREWRKGQTQAENVPLLSSEPDDPDLSPKRRRGIYSDDSYLFFAGDLNYRTASTPPNPEDVKAFPQPRQDPDSSLHYQQLLERDQLREQQNQGKTLHGLKEQPIEFPPTYKYRTMHEKPVLVDEDIKEWQWAPHRWPSWCDRILFSSTQSLPVKAGKYSALPIFRTSDHRPVALCVSIPLKSIEDSHFSNEAPAAINRNADQKRVIARSSEIVIGAGAYLGLTWQGNSMVLGTVVVLVGGSYLLKILG